MRAQIITLLCGEALGLAGLYFIFWPAALIVAGVQLVGAACFVDFGDDA